MSLMEYKPPTDALGRAECNYRRDHGIEVFMLWHREQMKDVITIITVSEDPQFNSEFTVAPEKASDAFSHPMAHRPLPEVEEYLDWDDSA